MYYSKLLDCIHIRDLILYECGMWITNNLENNLYDTVDISLIHCKMCHLNIVTMFSLLSFVVRIGWNLIANYLHIIKCCIQSPASKPFQSLKYFALFLSSHRAFCTMSFQMKRVQSTYMLGTIRKQCFGLLYAKLERCSARQCIWLWAHSV